jgi:hypothetical protein
MVAQRVAQSGAILHIAPEKPRKETRAERVERFTRNLTERWRAADPEWLARGMQWYGQVHGEVRALADAAGVSMELAAGIAAVLSIDNSWRRNFIGLGEVLSAVKGGRPIPTTCHRYSHVRAKVAAMVAGADPAWVMDNYGKGSPAHKCKRFRRNIMGDHDAVTIDRHAHRICQGTRDKSVGVPNGNTYLDCEQAHINAARILGIDPDALQAALWTDELREGAY